MPRVTYDYSGQTLVLLLLGCIAALASCSSLLLESE